MRFHALVSPELSIRGGGDARCTQNYIPAPRTLLMRRGEWHAGEESDDVGHLAAVHMGIHREPNRVRYSSPRARTYFYSVTRYVVLAKPA